MTIIMVPHIGRLKDTAVLFSAVAEAVARHVGVKSIKIIICSKGLAENYSGRVKK